MEKRTIREKKARDKGERNGKEREREKEKETN